jgi:uncharacterized peroxidase-related enzyme
MARVHVVDPATAEGEARALLDAARAQLGVVPNFLRVLANSPAALKGFLGLYGGLAAAKLDAPTRERVALVVGQDNECQYCVSAHTAIGRKAGLDGAEILAARDGGSADARAAVAVAFARKLNASRGEVAAADFDALRRAGYSDAEIVEIIAEVALNVFTNVLNKATDVEIDFPKVELRKAA